MPSQELVTATIPIGSTREYINFDKSMTHEALEAISAKGVSLSPALGNAGIIRSFFGLRPACRDETCILERIPKTLAFSSRLATKGMILHSHPCSTRELCSWPY